MKPGQELDALIAEKVMGLTKPECGWGEGDNGKGSFWNFPLRPYSTGIAAAWEIVDKGLIESLVKLKDGRWYAKPARLEINFETDEEELTCGFSIDYGYYEIPIYEENNEGAIANTAALAICLAALKVVSK